jgi:hypothetical protein
MTQIQAALTNTTTFIELWPIITEADADISFWGVRYVDVIGYEGTCPLDTLTGQVIELFERSKKTQFSKEECDAGITLKEKIDHFYSETDRKINEKNILTRLFFTIYECWICHIHNAGYGPRFDWRSGDFGENFKERLETDLK